MKHEKLLKYLNDYDPYILKDGTYTDNIWYYIFQGNSAIFSKDIGENMIISNKYGFIKYLYDFDFVDINNPDFLDLEELVFGNSLQPYEHLVMLLHYLDYPLYFLDSLLL